MLAVLNFGPTRQALTRTIANELSHKLQTKVTIENIQVGLFNRLIINGVTIKDKQKKDLLKAELMSVKVELRSLLKEQLSLRTISILDANINLYKSEPNTPTNFQFIIDAFASKKKKEPSELNLRINSLILRRVNLHYNELYHERTLRHFNPAHIGISNINANISLKKITKNELDLHVRSFAFKEQSGFELRKLRFTLHANRTKAEIIDFDLKLPHSHISQSELLATYDARNGWQNLWPTLRLQGSIKNTTIQVADLKPLLNTPDAMKLALSLSSQFDITPRYFRLNNIYVSEANNQLQLVAQATLNRMNGRFTDYSVQLKNLTIRPGFSQEALSWLNKPLPAVQQMVDNLGEITLNGQCYHNPASKSYGHINMLTAAGLLNAEAVWKGNRIQADVKLTQANPAQVAGNNRLPQLLTLNGSLNLELQKQKLHAVGGNVHVGQLLWNSHLYKDIEIKGSYAPGMVDVALNCDDPHADIHARTIARLEGKRLNEFSIKGNIGQFTPSLLGLNTPYGTAGFKADLDIDLKQLASNTPSGHLSIKDFSMTGAPQGDYAVQRVEAHLQQDTQEQGHLTLLSDFLDAELHGPLTSKRLVNGALTLLSRSLPGLVKQPLVPVEATDRWEVKASYKDRSFAEKMLGVKLRLDEPLKLQGYFDATGKPSSLSLFTNRLDIANQSFENPSVFFHGNGSRYQCLVKADRQMAGKPFKIVANIQTKDSILTTRVDWKALNTDGYSGAAECHTQFIPGGQTVNFSTHIHPTQFILDGTVWNIASGNLSLVNRELAFNNIRVSHEQQALNVNGRLAPHQNDSITADLKDIDIDYILELVNFHAVEFGGRATGRATFTKSADDPQLHAQLHIPDFTFNHGNMGDTHITGSWNPKDNRIVLDANMQLPQGHELGTKVKGYVSLADKGLELNIRANRTNLRFLRRYMDGIFEEFDGEATGEVKLYGPFKQLDFKGKLKANAKARIPLTGVHYNVSGGDVVLTPGEFAFKHFKVEDGRGGLATADGYLRHTHLKNLNYAFDIQATHLLCYDKAESMDLPFYSSTTGSGNVHLQGSPGRFIADINLRPEAPTTLVYTQGSPEALSTDDSMIRFRNTSHGRNLYGHSIQETSDNHANGNEQNKEQEEEESTTDIILNFLIDMNPSAQLKIITDPRSGDALTAYGNGPIRATFHNKGNFEMYGIYRLTRGTYKISVQDIIRKDLNLQSGSTITFGGNPMEADLGLKAIYTVNGVSLSDLNYGAGFSQKSVKVDCILNIGGKAKAPQVNFDLDLHNISDDEKQMVRQLIATDEDMNRQVIYLLGIGRFYAANTQSSVGQPSSQQQSAAAMRSFLSTTLTSQLNSAISSALGNKSHWSFGTNVAPGTLGWSDIEVDGLLQGRLFNDRLLINGNFGYRDRPTYTSNFVGDFDIRYLLTPRGNISLRAYSETTDRYFTKSSLTTQGVGVTLQRDFNTLGDLFNIGKRRQRKQAKAQKNGEKKKADDMTTLEKGKKDN